MKCTPSTTTPFTGEPVKNLKSFGLALMFLAAFIFALPLRALTPAQVANDPLILYPSTTIVSVADLQGLLNNIAADTVQTPRRYTGVCIVWHDGKAMVGLGYLNAGGPMRSLSFNVVLLGDPDELLVNQNVSVLQTRIDNILTSSRDAISSELVIVQNQLYLIVVNRQ